MLQVYGYIIVFSIIGMHALILSTLICRTSNNDVQSEDEVLSLLEEGQNIDSDSSGEEFIINVQHDYIINKSI